MIISDKTEFNKEEMVLIECDYKVSPKCKGIYYKMYKCILKGRENCEGKDRCISCFNSSTKTGKDNFNHKYDKDEDFFENIDSELKAYLLGWVAGDGSVKKDGIQLENHITDVSGLELFRENISPDAKFYKHADPIRGANTICLRINSVKIVSDLLRHLKLETYGKKSDKIQLPDLPDDLLWAFVRGLFDTDGCIISPSSKSTYPTSSICSTSKKMIHGLEELCDRNDIVYSSNEKRPTITFGGKNCLKFMEKIYGEANFFLQRKYDFWIIWKTWVPLYGTTLSLEK